MLIEALEQKSGVPIKILNTTKKVQVVLTMKSYIYGINNLVGNYKPSYRQEIMQSFFKV